VCGRFETRHHGRIRKPTNVAAGGKLREGNPVESRVYGYTPPKQPEPGTTRIRVCESEVDAYSARHPQLTRDEVLAVMKSAGPMRSNVEAELKRLSDARRPGAKVSRA
jgi:hypothetical protein